MKILEHHDLSDDMVADLIAKLTDAGYRKATVAKLDGYTDLWCCLDENQEKFMYLGTKASFEDFQKKRVN
jgi:hypothetical protein